MIDSEKKRTILTVEASAFKKKEHDPVAEGEVLGYLDGELVEAPFAATVESVSFNSEEHKLVVVLVERA